MVFTEDWLKEYAFEDNIIDDKKLYFDFLGKFYDTTNASGAFQKISHQCNYMGTTAATFNALGGFDFNAARSNSIYGNSSTVQPPALTLLPCIKY